MIDPETRQKVESVIEDIVNGHSTGVSLEKHALKRSTFYAVLDKDITIAQSFVRAQESRADVYAEDIISIADTEEDAQRARNKIDARKWVASKHRPSKYGDRIEVNHTATVDIRGVLAEFDARSLPIRDLRQDSDAQLPETKQIEANEPTGSKPVASIELNEIDTKDDIFS